MSNFFATASGFWFPFFFKFSKPFIYIYIYIFFFFFNFGQPRCSEISARCSEKLLPFLLCSSHVWSALQLSVLFCFALLWPCLVFCGLLCSGYFSALFWPYCFTHAILVLLCPLMLAAAKMEFTALSSLCLFLCLIFSLQWKWISLQRIATGSCLHYFDWNIWNTHKKELRQMQHSQTK